VNGVLPRIAAAARSERGTRQANEDATCVLQDDGLWVAVLADGAGGHRDGAEASRRAVAQLESALHRASPPFEAGSLTGAVLAAHASVRAGLQAEGVDHMHSTIVVLWIDAALGALWSHVGDSRLYRARGGRVDLMTVDDSVVQRMVEAGLLTPEQALSHPRKNQLVAALGIAEELQPHTVALPVPIEEGDAFLLCSDGWWNGLDDDCIAGTLAQARSPDDWLDAMRRRIESLALPRQDNFSAIALWIGDAGEVTRPRLKALVSTG
jgi:serine/threonine protein phosphatase PrpC